MEKSTTLKNISKLYGIITYICSDNIAMFQVEFFPIYGVIAGFNYSNEDIEDFEVVADDKRHTIQLFFFILGINIHFFTRR